jgi:hypothetical protein
MEEITRKLVELERTMKYEEEQRRFKEIRLREEA